MSCLLNARAFLTFHISSISASFCAFRRSQKSSLSYITLYIGHATAKFWFNIYTIIHDILTFQTRSQTI